MLTEKTKFRNVFHATKPLIGMIHLPSLPGYPTHSGMNAVINKALADLITLEKAGFVGVLVENDNDQPHQMRVNEVIREAFARIMREVISVAKIPVGMEIIYDMLATIEIAHKVHASFVRLDVFVDDVETKWGQIPASANDINNLLYQSNLNELILLTDIHVKHAKMLNKKTIGQSAREAVHKGSDGIIVTGTWTGEPPTLRDCLTAKKNAGEIPVLIGSGLNVNNASELFNIADGAIVGTSIKNKGYVDLQKAKKLIEVVNTSQRSALT